MSISIVVFSCKMVCTLHSANLDISILMRSDITFDIMPKADFTFNKNNERYSCRRYSYTQKTARFGVCRMNIFMQFKI